MIPLAGFSPYHGIKCGDLVPDLKKPGDCFRLGAACTYTCYEGKTPDCTHSFYQCSKYCESRYRYRPLYK
jgi:hypothetical protein